jgi:hypothetical protein
MTEQELQLLGFEKHSDEGIKCFDDEGNEWIEDSYYYYVYKITQGLELISNIDSDVDENNQWFVEIFNTDPDVRFIEFNEVQMLINLIESRVVKK